VANSKNNGVKIPNCCRFDEFNSIFFFSFFSFFSFFRIYSRDININVNVIAIKFNDDINNTGITQVRGDYLGSCS